MEALIVLRPVVASVIVEDFTKLLKQISIRKKEH